MAAQRVGEQHRALGRHAVAGEIEREQRAVLAERRREQSRALAAEAVAAELEPQQLATAAQPLRERPGRGGGQRVVRQRQVREREVRVLRYKN